MRVQGRARGLLRAGGLTSVVRDGDAPVPPPVSPSLPVPTARVWVDPASFQQPGDKAAGVGACTVPFVEAEDVDVAALAHAVRSLTVAVEALSLLLAGMNAALAKSERDVGRYEQSRRSLEEIKQMLREIRTWLPPTSPEGKTASTDSDR